MGRPRPGRARRKPKRPSFAFNLPYQAGLDALGNALQKFSEGRKTGRKVGFPRFKQKGRSNESVIFQRPRVLDSRHVCLDARRLGPVKTKASLRKLTRLLERDESARVLRSTVKRENGGWVISFSVERSPKRRRPSARNSRPLAGALASLRRLQRQVDRQRRANNPGNYLPDGRARRGCTTWVKSERMLKTERRVARAHARVTNLRREQAHQLTTALVREFGVIGVETLAVKNMMRNKRLSRHIADVGWGMILSQLKYKSSWVRGQRPRCRRPFLSLLEDVLGMRRSENQAAEAALRGSRRDSLAT